MKKKWLSMLLAFTVAVTMSFSITTISSFAADDGDQWGQTKESKNLLVFGASTSSGYGLSDYVNNKCGFDVENNNLKTGATEDEWVDDWTAAEAASSGRARISNNSYPWLLKEHIAKTEFGGDLSKVNLNSIALNGMRTDELRAMLDEDYYVKADKIEKEKTWYYKTNDSGQKYVRYCGFLGEHIDSFAAALGRGRAKVDGVNVYNSADEVTLEGGRTGTYIKEDGTISPNYTRMKKYVTQEIKNADVIVLDTCMNNFGTYLAERVAGYAKTPGYETKFGYYKQTIDDIDGVSDRTWSALKVLRTDLLEKTDFLESETAKQFVDSFLFCYADCVTNFSAIVEKIREINPNAKIIAQGVYNTLDGVKLVVDGNTVDFGELSAKGFALVNDYIKALDKNSPNYYYSDVSAGIETFMNQMVYAEEEDVNDFMNKDAENKSLMDHYFESFNEDFMGGMGTLFTYPEETVYQQMLVSNFDKNKITLTPWDDMDDADKIIGTTYVTASGPSKTEGDALTKQKLIGKACQDQGIDPNTFNDLPADTQQALVAGAKDYYENTIVPQYVDGGVTPKSWDDLELTEPITAITYVTMDTSKDSIAHAIKNQATDDVQGVKYLTKGNFEEFATSVVPNIYQLLYDAAHFTTIDLDRLFEGMSDMSSVNTEIQRFMMTGEQPSDPTMELLHIVDRFMLYMGLGQHPDLKGCLTMADDIIAAYDKLANGGYTAFEEVFEKYYPYVAGVALKIKEAYDNGDIDKLVTIMSKLDEISELMSVIDESGLTADQLKDFLKMKDELTERVGEILDHFDLTMEELFEKLNDDATLDEIDSYIEKFEKISAVLEVIDEEGLDADQVKALFELKNKLQDRAQIVLDYFGISIDDLLQMIDENTTPEKLAKYAEMLDKAKDLIDNLPTADEAIEMVKAELQKKLEELEKNIEDVIGGISEDLLAQIKEIQQMIKKAVDEGDYSEIIDKLTPIGERLLTLADAVNGLPEYQDAVNAYMEATNTAMAGLEDRVSTLEKQTDKLTAKSITVNMTPKALFPKKTMTLRLRWAVDEDAAGYELKVNGKAAKFTENGNVLTYKNKSAKVGRTYKFKITPYIIGTNDQKVYGKTYTKTFTPKVTLKKPVLKKVKAGKKSITVKWKKVKKANGYQISYKVGKKTKKKLVKGVKKLTKKIKKLKKGKKYTVKVRAYKIVNGKKYFSPWSKAKKVKTK